MSSLRSEDA
ncbi:hypothetical protein VTO73DRAFT_14491 [Trametes versicolor]